MGGIPDKLTRLLEVRIRLAIPKASFSPFSFFFFFPGPHLPRCPHSSLSPLSLFLISLSHLTLSSPLSHLSLSSLFPPLSSISPLSHMAPVNVNFQMLGITWQDFWTLLLEALPKP